MSEPAEAIDTVFAGVSFAYRFRDGQAELLTNSGIFKALHEPGGWVWIHVALTDEQARDWIAHRAPIPERGRAILLSDDDHQMLEPIDGGVAGVFVDLLRERESDGQSQSLGRLRFAISDTLVVSGRRDALGAIARTVQSIDAGKRFPDAIALLEAIVGHFADAVGTLAEELGETLDQIEEHVIDEAMRDERRRLGPVRRTAVRLHRQLASLRLLFRRWALPSDSELPSRVSEAAARLALRLEGLDHEVTAIQERARLLQDEIAAKLTADTNRHLFVLSVVTAFLLPPTLVAGIFGMNVTDLPFTKDAGGFFWAIGLTALSTAAVFVVMRRMRMMR